MNALKRLRYNDDIFILKAYKGNKIVIMDRTVYLDKELGLVENDLAYKKLRSDPLKNAKNFYNSRLNDLLKGNSLLIKNLSEYLPRLSYLWITKNT